MTRTMAKAHLAFHSCASVLYRVCIYNTPECTGDRENAGTQSAPKLDRSEYILVEGKLKAK